MSQLFLSLPQETTGERAKALGAYYTDAQIADFLVRWAVRSSGESVFDPCFGSGVFLRCACKRLQALGGDPTRQVFGVEIDRHTFQMVSDKLHDEFHLGNKNLVLADIFEIESGDERQFDSIVGNPPFIRYQRFAGHARKRALLSALQQNVVLSQLCSSWAPFLIQVVAMLKNGGRLGLVLPMEVAYATYAKPVLEYLRKTFERVVFLTFGKKLFPNLSEDTLLLLAENKDCGPGNFFLRDLPHAGQLARLPTDGDSRIPRLRLLNADGLVSGRERLVEHFIPRKARDLYRELKSSPFTRRLGALCDVGIGYVTGANHFFHLSSQQVLNWEIPRDFLRVAVLRSRALCGLRFTENDWVEAMSRGHSGYLLVVDSEQDLPASVRKYLQLGEKQGVPHAFKCRSRSPWFRVPNVYRPDAFLTYMSGATPRLVANDFNAVAPNTLHILRLSNKCPFISAEIAAMWQTSLTRLSVELEGHPLGGGMLKLEPTEAENVLLPFCDRDRHFLAQLAAELDDLARKGRESVAQQKADGLMLCESLGLNRNECRTLREAADVLRQRRYTRSDKS